MIVEPGPAGVLPLAEQHGCPSDIRDGPGAEGFTDYNFSPRFRDLDDQRFWRATMPGLETGIYGAVEDLARNRVNLNKVITHWPDMLKVAGALPGAKWRVHMDDLDVPWDETDGHAFAGMRDADLAAELGGLCEVSVPVGLGGGAVGRAAVSGRGAG
ncbi:hypothetical protein QFZ58_000125 [Streptomyces sp. B1I3]|nr:Tn3 family transposase [Streptomyces sp. B1I3]MDQ0791637.1 hypothetical protein [Streptomyces sp. B1I3]